MKNKRSGFKMKKFSGFGTKEYKAIKMAKQTTHADPGDFGRDILRKKKSKMATGKIAKKVATKIGGKLLGPVGTALAVKDAYGTYKDIKKGMKPRKAIRKNFLGF
tara:strand:+ start:74 stop:388 length:315 start_codon:yes stop_codon:yes gene_type:complete